MNLFNKEPGNKDARLESILHEIIVHYQRETRQREKTWKRFQEYKLQLLSKEKITIENINALIDFTAAIQQQKGPNRLYMEQLIFETFKYIVSCFLEKVDKTEIPIPFCSETITSLPGGETKKRLMVVLEIVDFIHRLLGRMLDRKHSRDSLWGERKTMALDLLLKIYAYTECVILLEPLAECLSFLDTKGKRERSGNRN